SVVILDDTDNHVSTICGDAVIRFEWTCDASGCDIGASSGGSGITAPLVRLHALGPITESQFVNTGGVVIVLDGTVDLTSPNNHIDTIAAYTNFVAIPDRLRARVAGSLSVGALDGVAGINLQGQTLNIQTGGSLTQTQPIHVANARFHADDSVVL